MPRAVLWDVGNVIVRWDPRILYSKIFEEPAQRDWFLSHVCTMDWHLQHDAGRPFAETIAELSAEYPEYALQIAAWRGRWMEMLPGAIPETEAAIEALAARGVAQFGLSNMSLEIWDEVKALSPVFRHLRDIVLSGAEGVVKPDPAIYAIALDRTGFAAADLLFIDDTPANIAAAKALGFDTHHFDDPAALAPALAARFLL